MSKFIFTKATDVPAVHGKGKSEGFEHYERKLIPDGVAEYSRLSIYELPPGKCLCPYHYHTRSEEMFYILSGNGILRTPEGEREVAAGDFMFFPGNDKGAHRLTNSSDSEMLVYLDFGTSPETDIVFYPDSKKIGVYNKGFEKLYIEDDDVDYYHGE
jgi:uncharacterized cupin superfamily protein